MLTRIFIVTALLVAMTGLTLAQQVSPGNDLPDYLEYLASLGYDEYLSADFSEEIEMLTDNPVDINSARKEEIDRLFFLTPFQVNSILNYLSANGQIISIYEIAYIRGFDTNLADLISGYIVLRNNNTQVKGYTTTSIMTTMIYNDRDNTEYPGSPLKSATRIRHSDGPLSIGLTFEKDKGEKFFINNLHPDFFSGHIAFSTGKYVRRVVIGDYRVRFGQGLTIWQGFSPTTSPLSTNLFKGSSRIQPYSSTDENNFFRGIAIEGGRDNLNFSLYISSNKIDAKKEYSPDSTEYISSLYDGGLHTTPANILKYDALTEYSAGININRNFNRINLGMSLTGTLFSMNIVPEERTETIYDFSGNRSVSGSIDYAASFNRFYLFGETAVTGEGRVGVIQGIRIDPADRVRVNLVLGTLSKGYNSFHGKFFGKETINNFRNSFMGNIQLDVAPKVTINGGVVRQSDLWFGYRSSYFPLSIRYVSEIVFSPNDLIRFKLTAWQKRVADEINNDQGIDPVGDKIINSARINIDISPLQYLKLSSRAEINSIPGDSEKGFLAYQGARIDSPRIPVSLIFRFYTYSTPSYDNRIYAWEEDLLFSPSVPALYGRGSRSYYILDFHPGKRFSLRLKYGYTEFISGASDLFYNEVRLQLRIRI